MWLAVQSRMSEILITLAHAQAEADQATELLEPVTASIAENALPLHRLWEAMHELAASQSVLAEPADFVLREQEALDLAGAAIVRCWADLGLVFTPNGDGFRIAVAHPMNAWPPKENSSIRRDEGTEPTRA